VSALYAAIRENSGSAGASGRAAKAEGDMAVERCCWTEARRAIGEDGVRGGGGCRWFDIWRGPWWGYVCRVLFLFLLFALCGP